MKKNLKLGIVLMLLCTLFTASGQLFFKYGSQNFSFEISNLITNYNLLPGFLLYGIGAVLLIIALKFGNLSTIYPFVSLTFIWVMLISFFVLRESMNRFKVGAIIFIILGVIAIARGEKSAK